MNEEENLTPTQLAKRWGISRVWVYKLLKKGHVPKHRKTGMGVRPRIVFPMKDKFGWGLEMSEILDAIDFKDKHVKTAISTLIKKKTINKKQLKFKWSTNVRVFYNDTKKEQK